MIGQNWKEEQNKPFSKSFKDDVRLAILELNQEKKIRKDRIAWGIISIFIGALLGLIFIWAMETFGQEQTQILDASKPVRISWTCSANATGYIPERAVGEGPFLPMNEVTECLTEDEVADMEVVRYRVRALRDIIGSGGIYSERIFSAYSEVSNRAVAILYPETPNNVKVEQ